MESPFKFHKKARRRAKRRRSPWNIVLLLIKWPLLFLWMVPLVKAVLWIPHLGALTFREAAKHNAQMFLIMIPLLFLSSILAMITANLLLYLIPHARRTFQAEAGGNPELQFAGAQGILLKIAAIIAMITIPIALIASWNIRPQ